MTGRHRSVAGTPAPSRTAIPPGTRDVLPEEMRELRAIGDRMRAVVVDGELDEYSPDNVSPLVAHLAAEDCTVTGRVLAVRGGEIREVLPWSLAQERALTSDVNWDIATVAGRLDEALGQLTHPPAAGGEAS